MRRSHLARAERRHGLRGYEPSRARAHPPRSPLAAALPARTFLRRAGVSPSVYNCCDSAGRSRSLTSIWHGRALRWRAPGVATKYMDASRWRSGRPLAALFARFILGKVDSFWFWGSRSRIQPIFLLSQSSARLPRLHCAAHLGRVVPPALRLLILIALVGANVASELLKHLHAGGPRRTSGNTSHTASSQTTVADRRVQVIPAPLTHAALPSLPPARGRTRLGCQAVNLCAVLRERLNERFLRVRLLQISDHHHHLRAVVRTQRLRGRRRQQVVACHAALPGLVVEGSLPTLAEG